MAATARTFTAELTAGGEQEHDPRMTMERWQLADRQDDGQRSVLAAVWLVVITLVISGPACVDPNINELDRADIGQACGRDSDCKTGLRCELLLPGGMCTKPCSYKDPCAGSFICSDGMCYPPCTGDSDCKRGAPYSCVNGACADPAAFCSNGVANQYESDVDCGGACAPCADGKRCVRPTDCLVKGCLRGVCSHCGNGVLDRDEEGEDCGGADCFGCPCFSGPATCASGCCQRISCRDKSCCDGQRDNAETDVDCGGPKCGPCGFGQACKVDSDCMETIPPLGPVALTCVAGRCGCGAGLRHLVGGGCECDPQTCWTCCSGKGCGPPDTLQRYCGRKGELCSPCNNGACTTDGDCVPFCGVPWCNGCCDGMACIGNSDAHCGPRWGGCKTCPPGTHCVNEVCM